MLPEGGESPRPFDPSPSRGGTPGLPEAPRCKLLSSPLVQRARVLGVAVDDVGDRIGHLVQHRAVHVAELVAELVVTGIVGYARLPVVDLLFLLGLDGPYQGAYKCTSTALM